MKIRVNDWQSYNGQPLKADEVLVPQLVDEDYVKELGANMANVRTWHMGEIYYTVMFVPVKKSEERAALKVFQADVNELLDEKLGPNRHSRCLVPQPDGSVKPCPKKKGDNHAACDACPYRGKLEKEDRSVVYWSQLEETEYAAGTESHVDDTYRVEMLLKELIEELEKINPKIARIVTLGYAGYSKAEIFDMIGVQKSQGYDLFKEAEKLTKEFLYD